MRTRWVADVRRPSRGGRSPFVRITAASAAVVLVLGACDDGSTPAKRTPSSELPAAQPGSFKVGGGIRYLWVTDAPKSTAVTVYDGQGKKVGSGTTDSAGSLVVRDLEPGTDFRVQADTTPRTESKPVRVLSEQETPDQKLYDQELKPGINYVTMRDGIELAMTVRLPQGATIDDAPFPTVIEYSGYAVAAPGNLLDSVLNGASDPLAPPTSTAVGALVAPILGYATVSVQMRGSGCSGGDFDLFDFPTTYDGYDAVETVANQSWVKGNKVGMVGISFSGISQLFVAGSRPPHLAAIAPLSVVHDLYDSPGYPGGIPNSGFAASWVDERERDARPAPDGQAYAAALIAQGDEHCKDNQKLRLQTRKVADILGTDQPFRDPALFDRRAPETWAKKIDVPTFIVGAFQDEQTGGAWPEVVTAMRDNPNVWATLMNGTHVDSLGPATIGRWAEFLSIFVADQPPTIPDGALALAPVLYRLVAKAEAMPVPAIRYSDLSLDAAREAFARDPRVRVLFDNGGGADNPGSLAPQREQTFDAWPPKGTATDWYFGANGSLDGATPNADSTAEYVADPSARPADNLVDGEDSWWALPKYEWEPLADGKGVGFVSEPLDTSVTIAGPASADIWLKSTAKDTDLQVTISEVRDNGDEMLVQSGWLRASHRKLDDRSTDINPRSAHLEADAEPLPSDEYSLVRVPIFPFAHTFRAGTRLRVTIQAPGGDRQIWRFATIDDGNATNTIAIGGDHASKLVVNVVATEGSPGALPPCPSNRAQPCRKFARAKNGG